MKLIGLAVVVLVMLFSSVGFVNAQLDYMKKQLKDIEVDLSGIGLLKSEIMVSEFAIEYPNTSTLTDDEIALQIFGEFPEEIKWEIAYEWTRENSSDSKIELSKKIGTYDDTYGKAFNTTARAEFNQTIKNRYIEIVEQNPKGSIQSILDIFN